MIASVAAAALKKFTIRMEPSNLTLWTFADFKMKIKIENKPPDSTFD